MINKLFLMAIIISAIIIFIVIIGSYLLFRTENFEDKVKYEQSKIIYNNLKNNRVDFDEYKRKLKNYPELMDVTIYDKVKQVDKFTVNDIYSKL